VRLPTLGGIDEEALWGEAAPLPATAAVTAKAPLAPVPEGQAPAPVAAASVPSAQRQQQAASQQVPSVQRDSDGSLRR
jgi:hypothetical protein